MQSSIQQPNVNTSNGLGYWPAFWMLGAPLRSGVTWPTSARSTSSRTSTDAARSSGRCIAASAPAARATRRRGLGSGERACSGCQTGYHTYGVQIDRSVSPEQIRWYLDGSNYFTLNANVVDATTWANAVDHPFFIIYDLAMGGGFPGAFGGGPTAATVSGGQMNVDYVAVYNKAPGSGGGRWRRRHRAHRPDHRQRRQVRRRERGEHRRRHAHTALDVQRNGRAEVDVELGRQHDPRARQVHGRRGRRHRERRRRFSSGRATAPAHRSGRCAPTDRCSTRSRAAVSTIPDRTRPTARSSRSGTATARSRRCGTCRSVRRCSGRRCGRGARHERRRELDPHRLAVRTFDHAEQKAYGEAAHLLERLAHRRQPGRHDP